MEIKIQLVEIRNPKNWEGAKVISLRDGVLDFISSDGKCHFVSTREGNLVTLFGKIYQIVGYNPLAEEEDYYLPLCQSQWRLSTRFLYRDNQRNLVPNTKSVWLTADLNLHNEYVIWKKVEFPGSA